MVVDLFGRPLRDLRISVTDRCNFRCTFCMPVETFGQQYNFLKKTELLNFEEIFRLAGLFVNLGVTKIRLTGGEPLLRNGIEDLIAMIAGIDGLTDLALTTNGFLLAKKARIIKEAGLNRVTVSLHSLDDEIFGEMNGRGIGTTSILEGIRVATEVGLTPIKINVVVQKNVNDRTIIDLARAFKDLGHVVRFIEYMDVGNLNDWDLEDMVSGREIMQTINSKMPIEAMESNYASEVAQRYRYKDGNGEVGVIASISEPFCGSCARIRLSAEGKVYTCLFANSGYDLKTPLRAGATDEKMRHLVTDLWKIRQDRYSEIRSELVANGIKSKKVEMYHIGG